MYRIALQSLLFDRARLAASLLGVALASTLGFVQIGLYLGFEQSASVVIDRIGGDLWAVPRGLEVIDYSQVMSVAPRNLLLSHPCVRDVRAVLYGFAFVQRPSGARSTAIVVAVEPRNGREPVPWGTVEGSVPGLADPLRISVDRTELAKLGLPADPLGQQLEVNGQLVTIAAVTGGIRSFTLNPYLFTSPSNARRLLNVGENEAMYYVVDLVAPGCEPGLRSWMRRQPELQLVDTGAWSRATRAYWVGGSGAGSALAFTALLGLIVGGVIVGQTLYSMIKEHLLELATLKALGATALELAGFVLWQVAFLAGAGIVSGLALARLLRGLLAANGLTVVLSPQSIGISVLATVGMCLLASVSSLVAVLRVEAAAVLR